MKRWLFLALLLVPTLAFANPALVQHNVCATGGTTSVTCTFGGAITAGNLVVVGCGAGNSTTFTVSDSVDGSYTVDTSNTASSLSVAAAHKENHSGSSPTLTCANGGPSTSMQMFIAEFSGVVTSTPLDGTPANNLTLGSKSPTTGSITTAIANSVVIGYVNINGNSGTIDAGAGFTITDKDEAAAILGGAMEYQVDTGTGAINPSFTLQNSGNSWGTTTAFKSSGGGGGGGGCKGFTMGVWSCF